MRYARTFSRKCLLSCGSKSKGKILWIWEMCKAPNSCMYSPVEHRYHLLHGRFWWSFRLVWITINRYEWHWICDASNQREIPKCPGVDGHWKSWHSSSKCVRRLFSLLLFCCNQINKPSNFNARFAPRTVDSTINSQWLYNFIADLWSDWLPAEALSTLRVGGYYSFVFRPGLRVIVLNNNHCFVFNTWVRVFNLYVFVVNLNTFHFLWIATVGCIIARVKWLPSLNGCVIH